MSLVCCQLQRHARYVAAHPWFENGSPIALGNAKQHANDVGKLALVQAGARGVGRVVEVLGPATSLRAVMRGLLGEEGLLGPDPAPRAALGEPSAQVREQLDALPSDIPFAAAREDHRADLVVTIDPPTAKDHDDAVGLTPAPEGAAHAWDLAVHIADVSAYVPTGSPIDLEAAGRAMSAYVPGMVAPMLPHELSSDLCSLRPGVDRGCVSVVVQLDADGAVVGTRFARTLIRSARRLSYDEVDAVLSKARSVDPVIDELLRRLDAVTARLRARRMERGALDMALPDVEIELDDAGDAVAAHLAAESPSHRLVEECMLLANDAVGLRLAQANAPGMWRIHEHPEPQSIDALVAVFEQLGVPTPPLPDSYAGREAAALASSIVQRAQRYAETARRGRHAFAPRVLRALQQADYRARSGPHSGLATEHYAHFTSPIRRYPDLVVHRSLLRLIGLADDEPAADDLHALAQHVSSTERELIVVERRANRIALAQLLHRHMHGQSSHPLGDDGQGRFRGEVTGLIGAGLFVRFGDVFEGFVPARTLSADERYQLDDAGLAMVGTRSGHRFRLGDRIDVYVDRVDTASGKIDLRRIGGRADDGGAGRSTARDRESGRGGRGKRPPTRRGRGRR